MICTMNKFFNIIIFLFALIGAFNIGVGIYLTVKKMFDEKLKIHWVYVYFILTALGIVALKEIGYN